jgi:protein SCO1
MPAARSGFVAIGIAAAMLALALMPPARAETAPIDWSLRGLDGRVVAMRDMPPKWLLIYFGYTYCPDLCPTALIDMAEILRRLDELSAQIQPVFISIDPARDTAELIGQYLTNFALPILALTGSETELHRAAELFDFHYVRYQDPELRGYSFDHSSSFFLVDPDRRSAAAYATEIAPEEIAASLHDLLLSRPKSLEPRSTP